MLKKAYVEITNRCNLACSFCPKTKREPRMMSAQEFGLVLSRLEGYVQYVYLHVMGEPLLHPELPTLFALAKARDMKICITTNGTLLQKRSDELLAAESLHKISVSLHSFEGNDGADEQELSYLTQVWNFAEKAAKKGVIVALRLWNDGGADARNGEILDFLRSRTGDNWPEMRNGSFLLRCEGKMVYHGGDLNWWNWESEGKAYCNNMTVHYHAAIEKLASAVRNEATDNNIAPEITAAMAPLDPRLGEGSEGLGIEYLLKNVTVQHVFPMHMWKKYEVIDRYIAAHPDEKGIIARITRDGQQFEI